MTDQEEYDAARSEASSKFDLRARLQNRGLREATVTLYLDEVAGEKLGTAEDITQMNVVLGRKQTGILGDIDKLDPDDEALPDLERQRDDLIATLESSALVVKLRSVPPIVAKGAKRKARETLKIKGKVTEDLQEDYNDAYVAHLLADTIVSITDKTSGETNTKIAYDDARALKEYLPLGQFRRLDQKLAEIQFEDAISEKFLESDSDF